MRMEPQGEVATSKLAALAHEYEARAKYERLVAIA